MTKSYSEKEITRVMQNELQKFNKEFQKLYTREHVLLQIMDLEKLVGKSSYNSKLFSVKKILTSAGIDCSKFKTLNDYKKAATTFCSEEEFNSILIGKFYKLYQSFPKSQNFIERLVRRLGDDEFRSDSVRLAIVKQFIKYTDYGTMPVKNLVLSSCEKKSSMSKKEKTQYVLENIDESVFDILESSLTPENRRKYTLLKLADDLANARFRTNGRTRNDLYAFAMAFKMTCFVDLPGQIYDKRTDIEKNLFFDFYNDSLFRYISEDYCLNSTNFEAEPTGEGINLKNFAEVVYIYFMLKTEYTVSERLKKAEEIIKACALSKEEESFAILPTALDSMTFAEQVTNEVFTKNEDELVEYICKNYTVPVKGCLDDEFSEKKNKFTFASNQNTAYERYRYYIDEVSQYLNFDGRESILSIETDFLEGDFLEDEDFIKLIDTMNQMLRLTARSKGETQKEVTRTKLLVVFAHHFACTREFQHLSLPEFFELFSSQANKLLVECRYQTISANNIFDYLLIVALYINR